MLEQIVKYPFGEASELSLSATGAQALEINNAMTVVDGASIAATGARTINLAVSESVALGDRILFKLKTAATQETDFGTGITGASITGVEGKTKTVEAVFDGSNFVVSGAPVQIDSQTFASYSHYQYPYISS